MSPHLSGLPHLPGVYCVQLMQERIGSILVDVYKRQVLEKDKLTHIELFIKLFNELGPVYMEVGDSG